MSRRSEKRRRNRRKQKTAPLLLMGGGVLIILGVLAALWLPSRAEKSTAPTGGRAGNSVIPVEVPERPAPDLKLQDLEGNPVSLADYRGQVVLLNNWATWCPPCKAEMPDLEAYHEAHKDEGFTVIAVNAGDRPNEVAAFAQAYHLTFPVWPDPSTETLRAFGIQGLPTSYLIDRNGMVRATWTGAITQAVLEEYITPYIKEKN